MWWIRRSKATRAGRCLEKVCGIEDVLVVEGSATGPLPYMFTQFVICEDVYVDQCWAAVMSYSNVITFVSNK